MKKRSAAFDLPYYKVGLLRFSHFFKLLPFCHTQVLFRYAIAIFKYMEDALLRQSDYMSIFHTLRDGLEDLKDIRKLTQVGTDFI